MNIQDVLRMDHNKVNTLFTELLQSNDAQKIQEYFGQLYKDLSVHAAAEEEVLYPRVRSFYGDANTQELYEEQANWRTMLAQLQNISPATAEFKERIRLLMDDVADHVRQEESTMFTAIRNNMNTQQTEELASEFKAAKSRIQQQMESAKTQAQRV
jgi:hemerythrin superfamily protein